MVMCVYDHKKGVAVKPVAANDNIFHLTHSPPIIIRSVLFIRMWLAALFHVHTRTKTSIAYTRVHAYSVYGIHRTHSPNKKSNQHQHMHTHTHSMIYPEEKEGERVRR